MDMKNQINKTLTKIVNNASGLAQAEIDRANVPKIITDGMPEKIRRAAREGAVLLKNDGVLPLKRGSRLSLFSRVSQDWFYVGYGSGGDVNEPYHISLTDGIRNCPFLEVNESLAKQYEDWAKEHPINHGFWGKWPFFYPDMPLSEETVIEVKSDSDAAVVTIGRSSGEDRDCKLEKGSYYLTDDEEHMLHLVCAHFEKVVVLLNVGGIMDMAWLEKYGDKIGAVMYVWQGGMESGNAIADLLSGIVSPCGRLTDTIAKHYSDYPSSDSFGGSEYNDYTEDIFVGYRYFESFKKDSVLFPFGFGLSYSTFDTDFLSAEAEEGEISIRCLVKNTGTFKAKDVVQLYLKKPCGKLGNPERELVAFGKTSELEPGKEQELELTVSFDQFASYDDCGMTGHPYAYVAEEGEYAFFLGSNVRDAKKVFSYYQAETQVVCQCRQAAAPQKRFDIFCAREERGKRLLKIKNAQTQRYDLASRIKNHLPEGRELTGNLGYKLSDVKNGKVSIEDFVAQLGLNELEAITRGDYKMDSPFGAKGNAGAFGGVLSSLRDKGIPPVITTDGPSGIRLRASCSLIPIGVLLACSFNTDLVEDLYGGLSKEMVSRGTDVLLAPGMNIHRNPLCGRNFEYYSEDPFLTGKMGAAAVRGIQSEGVSACPKHFACNNQEYRRNVCDSRLSERALREIYLKGFEICIKEAEPINLMTSYNKINGVWGHYHYDLCTTILREEWGYQGNVMTDWWMKSSKSPEFPVLEDHAYRIRAQVDLFMPGGKRITNGKPDGTLLKSYGKSPDGITLGEMQRSAINVLNAVMKLKMK